MESCLTVYYHMDFSKPGYPVLYIYKLIYLHSFFALSFFMLSFGISVLLASLKQNDSVISK